MDSLGGPVERELLYCLHRNPSKGVKSFSKKEGGDAYAIARHILNSLDFGPWHPKQAGGG